MSDDPKPPGTGTGPAGGGSVQPTPPATPAAPPKRDLAAEAAALAMFEEQEAKAAAPKPASKLDSQADTQAAEPKPRAKADATPAAKVTGGDVTLRSCVRSKTCMPWLGASLTMNAWSAKTLMPRQVEGIVFVGRSPR